MNWTVCQQGISIIRRNIWQRYGDPRRPNMFCGPSSSTGGGLLEIHNFGSHFRSADSDYKLQWDPEVAQVWRAQTYTSFITSSGMPWKPPHKHRRREFSLQCFHFVNLFPVSGSIGTSWNTDKIQRGMRQFPNPSPSCVSHVTSGRIPFKATDLL